MRKITQIQRNTMNFPTTPQVRDACHSYADKILVTQRIIQALKETTKDKDSVLSQFNKMISLYSNVG